MGVQIADNIWDSEAHSRPRPPPTTYPRGCTADSCGSPTGWPTAHTTTACCMCTVSAGGAGFSMPGLTWRHGSRTSAERHRDRRDGD